MVLFVEGELCGLLYVIECYEGLGGYLYVIVEDVIVVVYGIVDFGCF